MLVEMELREIQISENLSGHQIIILGEKGGTRVFPIYIGFYEAYAMDNAVRKVKTIRPMTHDLIWNIIDGLDIEMKRVIVDELKNDTFFGKLVLESGNGAEILIDSRPSDAIVLASKRDVPIFVEEKVLDEVCRDFSSESEDEENP
jgi:bifunctional DNase/RNase